MAEAVAQLRQQQGKDLTVMGGGELIQTLMPHGLIDEYLLLIHPLVLGAGRRLFADGGPPASLRLVDSEVSTTRGLDRHLPNRARPGAPGARPRRTGSRSEDHCDDGD